MPLFDTIRSVMSVSSTTTTERRPVAGMAAAQSSGAIESNFWFFGRKHKRHGHGKAKKPAPTVTQYGNVQVFSEPRNHGKLYHCTFGNADSGSKSFCWPATCHGPCGPQAHLHAHAHAHHGAHGAHGAQKSHTSSHSHEGGHLKSHTSSDLPHKKSHVSAMLPPAPPSVRPDHDVEPLGALHLPPPSHQDLFGIDLDDDDDFDLDVDVDVNVDLDHHDHTIGLGLDDDDDDDDHDDFGITNPPPIHPPTGTGVVPDHAAHLDDDDDDDVHDIGLGLAHGVDLDDHAVDIHGHADIDFNSTLSFGAGQPQPLIDNAGDLDDDDDADVDILDA